MPNNDADLSRHYQDAMQAQMGERVTNLGRRVNDIEAEMRAGFTTIGNSLNAFTTETRNSIAALSASIAERNKPQWQALGVMVTVIVVLGGLVYWPIRETQSDIKAAILNQQTQTAQNFKDLAAGTVSRQEMDWRAARGAEDRDRTTNALTDLRSATVTRTEWMERTRATDQQLAEITRRIEELRGDFGSTYTARDVLLSTQADVKDLRAQLRALYQAIDRPIPPPSQIQ